MKKKPRDAKPSPPQPSASPTPTDPSSSNDEPRADSSVERRFSAKRKVEVIQRMLAGEPLDLLARELGLTASRLAEWRDAFLAAGQSALKSRETSVQDDEVRRLKAMVGDLTMRLELSREKIRSMEAGRPLCPRRSRP